MRWFPFSSYHVNPIALHLSDHTLTLLRLNKKREVESFARVSLPKGVMEDGRVLDKEKLASAIRSACKEALPKVILLNDEIPVIFSVPESQSFTHVFSVPSSAKKEDMAELVRTKAAHLIPMDLALLYGDWYVISHEPGGMDRVLFASAPREIIDAYIAVCESCDLLPIAIDMETVSLSRALLAPGEPVNVIMDIGSRTTSLGFFDDAQRLILSVSVPIAGNALTNAIVERMKVSVEDAEALKMRQGLDRTIPDNRVLIIVQERLQMIVREMQKAFTFFESSTRMQVKKILFAGGTALLPEIVTYFSMNDTHPIMLGNPLAKIGKAHLLGDPSRAILLAPVIGIALRATAENVTADGINLLHGWEGERWEEREERILKQWRRLAIPVFAASIVLLSYVAYAYLYLPSLKLRDVSSSRVALLGGGDPARTIEGSSTPPITSSPVLDAASTTASSSPDDTVDIEATMIDQQDTSVTFGRITETPTGWLNVRTGPGSEFSILTKVIPLAVYPVVTEKEEWIEILFSASTTGWVSRTYIDLFSSSTQEES